jgi:hypothetical protein
LAYESAGRLAETSGGSAGTTRLGYDGTDLAADFDLKLRLNQHH